MDYRTESPEILRDFLSYHETIKGHSRNTVDEYFLDLRNFFRYLKIDRDIVRRDIELDDVDIMDVDLAFVSSVTLTEVYSYLGYLSRDRVKHENAHEPEYGLTASSRARKIATIRSFYKYLTVKAKLMDENPIAGIDSPKTPRTLPRYLSLEESRQLLNAVDGVNRERDFCILTLFLNCGLRISEIVGLNIQDVAADHLRILGKGSKERIVFLNDACAAAINAYLPVRARMAGVGCGAMFISTRRKRMSVDSVQVVVKRTLLKAGLDADKFSAHKLRHTAATLMLQNGVDVRTLQEVLGHEHLNTTQIYTHVDNSELRTAAAANPLASFIPHGDREEPET